ncbi:MAG: phospholipase D-like domain-containing protein [Deinococcales bacterium]
MPIIFDNIEQSLLTSLRQTLAVSQRADFCVGYFNLRGWQKLDDLIETWQGNSGSCCRLLIGMSRLPEQELQQQLSFYPPEEIDNASAKRLSRQAAEHFRQQLMMGIPNNEDEAGLRRLSRQLKTKKLVVKLHLRHPLHAKLYLLYREDVIAPLIGFLGSSNLTLPGLSYQGELNIDVLEQDAAQKLSKWFEDRWQDRFSLDISQELAAIIDESWAREILPTPFEVYLKMAYHLSQEARLGLAEFNLPRDLARELLDFQAAAVQIAAHHLNKRGGVVIGDVVGLGKSLMAVAIAKIFQEDFASDTLIICPKNLVPMWEDYVARYRLRTWTCSKCKATHDRDINAAINILARFVPLSADMSQEAVGSLRSSIL